MHSIYQTTVLEGEIQIYLPGFAKEMTSVTLVMKIRPLSWSLLFLFRGFGVLDLVLSFLLLFSLFGFISLQHSRMNSKR